MLDQRSINAGVPLDASDNDIELCIEKALTFAREDLASRGVYPPFAAPPLPSPDLILLGRMSEDGLRIVVQTVLDIDGQPWFIGVRVDAFENAPA